MIFFEFYCNEHCQGWCKCILNQDRVFPIDIANVWPLKNVVRTCIESLPKSFLCKVLKTVEYEFLIIPSYNCSDLISVF